MLQSRALSCYGHDATVGDVGEHGDIDGLDEGTVLSDREDAIISDVATLRENDSL